MKHMKSEKSQTSVPGDARSENNPEKSKEKKKQNGDLKITYVKSHAEKERGLTKRERKNRYLLQEADILAGSTKNIDYKDSLQTHMSLLHYEIYNNKFELITVPIRKAVNNQNDTEIMEEWQTKPTHGQIWNNPETNIEGMRLRDMTLKTHRNNATHNCFQPIPNNTS